MSPPRNYGYLGPANAITYSRHYRDIHDRIVNDITPDSSFHSHISNSAKVEYICRAVGMPQHLFHLDTPFPIEDWAASNDTGLITCGLYLTDLRRRFFGHLIYTKTVPENSTAWAEHAKAEFWSFSFNFALNRRNSGDLPMDERVLN